MQGAVISSYSLIYGFGYIDKLSRYSSSQELQIPAKIKDYYGIRHRLIEIFYTR